MSVLKGKYAEKDSADTKNMANKTLYWAALLCLVVFIAVKFNPFMDYPEVLPDAGYCIEYEQPVKYTTMMIGNESMPIEYCPLQSFCKEYYASTVLSDEKFDEQAINAFITLHDDLDCFTSNAFHTQRNFDRPLNNKTIKTKYVCCNTKSLVNVGYCQLNICDGKFTGITDKWGCRIYAKYDNTTQQYKKSCGGYKY